MKDYTLLFTDEYLKMTGKSRWAAMRDLIRARDAEERQRLIKVVNMLKARRAANEPKFSNTRWGQAAAKALQYDTPAARASLIAHRSRRQQQPKSGWDLLLSGDTAAAAAGDQGAGAGAHAPRTRVLTRCRHWVLVERSGRRIVDCSASWAGREEGGPPRTRDPPGC